jgi:hypothetical protein
MRFGFTGSGTKTFPPQRAAFTSWVSANANRFDGFDHGDCIEADAFAHDVVREFTAARIAIHPPLKGDKRAFREGDEAWMPKPYLSRNQDVVRASDMLLAMPHGEEELRSGTWSTIRFARKLGRPVVIFWPDGQITSSEEAIAA